MVVVVAVAVGTVAVAVVAVVGVNSWVLLVVVVVVVVVVAVVKRGSGPESGIGSTRSFFGVHLDCFCVYFSSSGNIV